MPSWLLVMARLAGHVCRLLLGFVLLYAGLLKALDPVGFAREVAQYGLLPELATLPFAFVLIPVEVAAGSALLLNFRPVLSFSVAAALMLMFIGAIGYAIMTDQPVTECGCFGRQLPRTPAETLRDDLGFLAAALVGLFAARTPRRVGAAQGRARWKGPVLAAVALASGVFVVASPVLPIDDLATSLRPGVRWEDLGIALAEVDLTRGRHLVVLMGLREEATVEALEAMNRIAESGNVGLIGLHSDDDAASHEFFWNRGPAFPLYQISSSDMRRLHRKLPRFFVVSDGVVKATWDAVPTESQALGAMR